MQKWEYHVWYLETGMEAGSIRDELDQWGREGWELVSVVPHEAQISGPSLVAIFKRPEATEATEGGSHFSFH